MSRHILSGEIPIGNPNPSRNCYYDPITIAAVVTATAATVGVVQSRKASKQAKAARSAQQEAADRAAAEAREATRLATQRAIEERSKQAIQRASGDVGAVATRQGATLGEAEEEDKRQTVRKKRLGTAKLRIPLQQETAASGLSVGTSDSGTGSGLRI